MEILLKVFMLLGGLAFFLYGMNVLSGGLSKLAGGALERSLKRMTSNRLAAMGLGIGITCTGTFTKSDVEKMGSWEKPLVFIDACPDLSRFDAIVVDYRSAVRRTLDYLTSCGHTRIAFIGGVESNEISGSVEDGRITAYREYMMEKGFYRPELIKVGKFNARSAYELCTKFFEEGNAPTAIFVSNDSMGAGAYRAAYQQGLRIPQDLSVVGFNDIPGAKYMVPPLTTCRLPMDFMGEYAVKMLEDRVIHGRDVCIKTVVPAELHIRDSVCDIGAAEPTSVFDDRK